MAWQLIFFGVGFIVLVIISDGSCALLAGALSGKVRRTAKARRRLDLSSGMIYLLLGLVAATVTRS